MDLATTRLDPRDESDLRWLWWDAPGEMGESSAMGAFVAALERGSVRSPVAAVTPDPTRRIEAVIRYRRITRRLAALGDPRHIATLRAAYGPGLPHATVRALEPLATATLPVALLLLVAARAGIKRAALAHWATPPASIAKAANPRAAREQWERQRDAALAPLRLAAQADLMAAAVALNALPRLRDG